MTWNAFVCSLLLLSGMRLFLAKTTNGVVKQSPLQYTVTEGGTVQLNCTYIRKVNNTQKRVGSIAWYKNEENRTVSNKSGEFRGRVRANSSTGILSQHLQIFNVRMNDAGKYYCKVEIFGSGYWFGKGSEVQVTAAAGHDEGLSKKERKIALYLSPLLVIVLLALTLFISISYRKRCVRSTGKGSAIQVVLKKEESVPYAEINIRKAPRTGRSDYAECEYGRTRSSSQARKGDDGILYAEVRATSLASMKPKKSPGSENDQVVYAAVNVERM